MKSGYKAEGWEAGRSAIGLLAGVWLRGDEDQKQDKGQKQKRRDPDRILEGRPSM